MAGTPAATLVSSRLCPGEIDPAFKPVGHLIFKGLKIISRWKDWAIHLNVILKRISHFKELFDCSQEYAGASLIFTKWKLPIHIAGNTLFSVKDTILHTYLRLKHVSTKYFE